MTKRESRLGRMQVEMPAAAPQPDAAPVEGAAAPSPPAETVGPCAGADALDLPAYQLGKLPLPTTLRCRHELSRREFIITTHRGTYDAAKQGGVAAFSGGELEALAVGASLDRVYPATLAGWLDRKLAEPGWTLTKTDAIGDYYPAHQRNGAQRNEPWSIGRVFARLGVRLLGVDVLEE